MNARPTRKENEVIAEKVARELDKKFDEMREDRKSMHEQNVGTMRRIEDKIDAWQPGVLASELARAKKDIEDLRDWKHSIDPFIARRVDL